MSSWKPVVGDAMRKLNAQARAFGSKGDEMKQAKFLELAGEAGFTGEQADLLWQTFSTKPHTHTADQITDLHDAVTEIVESTEEEDEDEDESVDD